MINELQNTIEWLMETTNIHRIAWYVILPWNQLIDYQVSNHDERYDWHACEQAQITNREMSGYGWDEDSSQVKYTIPDTRTHVNGLRCSIFLEHMKCSKSYWYTYRATPSPITVPVMRYVNFPPWYVMIGPPVVTQYLYSYLYIHDAFYHISHSISFWFS